MTKEKILSLTAKDFEWSYTRGTGKGGQKKNKTSSAVYCIHNPSKSQGYSEASRSQSDNKADAFKKCVNSSSFQNWLKIETARKMGIIDNINESVKKEMKRIKVEVKNNGKWVEVNKEDELNDNNDCSSS